MNSRTARLITLAVEAVVLASSTTARADLVGAWGFDGNLQDASGLGNNATGSPTYVVDRFGSPQGALGGNGAFIPYSPSLDITGTHGEAGLTISAWVNTGFLWNTSYRDQNFWDQAGTPAIAYSSGGTINPFQFGFEVYNKTRSSYWQPDGRTWDFGLCLQTPSGNWALLQTPKYQMPADPGWMQVTTTFDFGTKAAAIYVNGVQQASDVFPSIYQLGRETDGLRIAAPRNFFLSGVDDVRIYNNAISSQEVASLYQTSLVAPDASITWVNPGSESWDRAPNWSPSATPSALRDVTISPSNSLTVTGPTTPSAAKSLTVGGGMGTATLQLQPSGNISITNALAIKATGAVSTDGASLTSGSLNNEGAFAHNGSGTVVINGNANNGGTVYLAGDVRIDGNLNSTGAVIQNGGTSLVGGQLTIASGSGTQPSAYTLQSGTLKANSVSVERGASFAVAVPTSMEVGGVTSPSDHMATAALHNNGTITVYANGKPVLPVPRGQTEGIGDYTQAPTGVLHVVISGTAPGQFGQLAVDGTATLAGTLSVGLAKGYTPEVGDSFDVMSYSKLVGRFDTFSGSVVPGKSDRFLGLSYSSDHISVLTLAAPVRSDGSPLHGGGDLVLVTHGWNASANDKPIKNLVDALDQASGSAQVVTMDWSQYNALVGGPSNAAQNANDIGESLANWMHEEGYSYRRVHLVGHSAGAWLVNGLTDKLKQQGTATYVQDTFLDAYRPDPEGLFPLHWYGYDNSTPPTLGKGADYAEQYFYGDNAGNLGLARRLPDAVNYDVAGLDPLRFTQAMIPGDPAAVPYQHGWPIEWYTKTVGDPQGTDSSGGHGFGRSWEYLQTGHPSYDATNRKGSTVQLPSGVVYNTVAYRASEDVWLSEHSITGNVLANGTKEIRMSTVSAVSLSDRSSDAHSILAISSIPLSRPHSCPNSED